MSPTSNTLRGKLWEMRMKGKDTIARAIYVTVVEKRIVVLRVFTKKNQKTPRREIEIALERGKGANIMTKERRKTIPAKLVFAEWQRNPDFQREYAALEDEFALAEQFIRARAAAGLTQQELAKRMKTSQSYIARLEGGKETPSTRTLHRFAEATGHRVVINFEPRADL